MAFAAFFLTRAFSLADLTILFDSIRFPSAQNIHSHNDCECFFDGENNLDRDGDATAALVNSFRSISRVQILRADWRQVPLLDALSYGCKSFEADIHLVGSGNDTELLVRFRIRF